MSVGLVYRPVCSVSSSKMTVVSRKVSRSVEVSAVNLIVGWKRLICSRKVSSDSCLCSQMANMLSMYRHQTFGLVLVETITFSSRFAMNMFTYDGAILVPMAMP